MSFYRKTLLALFLTSSFLLVVAVLGAYRALSSSVTNNYRIRYRSMTFTLAETIEKLESGTEDTMRVALQALRYYTADHAVPSDDTLRVMERNLRVSSIEFIRQDGQFIRSTKYKISELPNLFGFCKGYRELFTGESEYDHTPLMPEVVDHQVLKFALLPTLDRRFVINVGMEVKYIGDLFRTVMESDRNLLSLALYTPSGQPLGSFVRSPGAAGDEIVEDAHPASLQMAIPGIASSGVDSIEINTPVKATMESCCECVGKGLVNDPAGRFFYVLRTKISLGDLRGSLERIAWTLAISCLLGLVFAFILSRVIARKLTGRIERINRKTREIADLKDLSVRFDLKGRDEISNIGRTMDRLLDSLEAHQTELVRSERSKALAEMARDLAHHIRSPLVAAENAVEQVGGDEQAGKIIKNAVREIRVLTDNLKAQADHAGPPAVMAIEAQPVAASPKPRDEKVGVHHLVGLIENLVAEKGYELRGRAGVEIKTLFSKDSYTVFAAVQPNDLKVALSNLINNAVEALPDCKGTVTVSCYGIANQVHVTVADTGHGISEELIPKLGQRGITSGKPGGTGLGLAHARAAAERWGGELTISSEVGDGTEVVIALPRADPPEWFVRWIQIPSDGTVVIVDDDPLIHETWKARFRPAAREQSWPKIVEFTKGVDFSRWVRESAPSAGEMIYLVDYELRGEEKTGLALIEELRIAARSILVTGRYDEEAIVKRVLWRGIRMIPKPLMGLVPIQVAVSDGKYL